MRVIKATKTNAGGFKELTAMWELDSIDTSKLEVVSHDTLIDDAAAASNKTLYQDIKTLFDMFI